jgi:hypothetical protein
LAISFISKIEIVLSEVLGVESGSTLNQGFFYFLIQGTQAGLELIIIPASATPVLGLQVCTTCHTPGLNQEFLKALRRRVLGDSSTTPEVIFEVWCI